MKHPICEKIVKEEEVLNKLSEELENLFLEKKNIFESKTDIWKISTEGQKFFKSLYSLQKAKNAILQSINHLKTVEQFSFDD